MHHVAKLEEGFALDVFWYDGADCKDSIEVVDEDSNTRISHAVRRVGKRILLVSKSELEQIAQITVNGELVAWRQGGFLINGTKFRNQEILCFSNDNVTGINRRASAVFDYLKKANPGVYEDNSSKPNYMDIWLEAGMLGLRSDADSPSLSDALKSVDVRLRLVEAEGKTMQCIAFYRKGDPTFYGLGSYIALVDPIRWEPVQDPKDRS